MNHDKGATLGTIDWHAPWLTRYAALGESAAQQVLAGTTVAQAFNGLIAQGAAPDPGVRFVAQQDLPASMAYELFILERAQVPTRDNLHDFFNALMWLYWPQAKRRMNQLHAAVVQAQGVGARRGPVRDALTVLDENGALLLAPQALQAALQARQWQQAFVVLRPLWQQAQLLIVGHALLEKLVHPRKAITAHIYSVPCAPENAALSDAVLAGALQAQSLAEKPFFPLPVLGIPGWCAQNANFCFYDDSVVFRPPAVLENLRVRPR